MPLLPSAAHVLLIEDHPDLQDALHATLTEEGVQVTLAASCAQAQVLLSHDAFDVIFTDLFRPLHGNPFRTLEGLRHQASSTPIMVITAWPLTAEDVVRRGYQGLLSHPFEREIVVALLKQGVALNSATAAQESAGRQRSASGEEGEGISGRLPTLLKVRAAYLPSGQQPCWQPTWMNGRELAPSEQEAGLYAFVTARRIEGWVLCLTTQGMTATGIPTLRLTFRHPTISPARRLEAQGTEETFWSRRVHTSVSLRSSLAFPALLLLQNTLLVLQPQLGGRCGNLLARRASR